MKIYGILLSGKQGSGKTTTSNKLKKYAEDNGIKFFSVKFADTLYEMHNAIKAIARTKGIPMPEKDGKLLQLLGTEWGRNGYGENIWVDAAKNAVANIIEANFNQNIMIVIDDCRFPNELVAFNNFLTVRLVADRDARKVRTDSWRDTENHLSETALDDFANNFDLFIDTTIASSDEAVRIIIENVNKGVKSNANISATV